MSVINTNITSMIGQSNLSKSQNALQTSMERLSSGLRINSAKDDAAGQAIANRMSAQITGLGQAQRNANDGISVAQTAEGGLNQINDNLQRIRELTVQAANGTNSQNDLQSIQDEVDQRLEEIDRISQQTDFNGTKVLDVDTKALKIQVGANDEEVITVDLEAINRDELGLRGFSVQQNALSVSAEVNTVNNGTADVAVDVSAAATTLSTALGASVREEDLTVRQAVDADGNSIANEYVVEFEGEYYVATNGADVGNANANVFDVETVDDGGGKTVAVRAGDDGAGNAVGYITDNNGNLRSVANAFDRTATLTAGGDADFEGASTPKAMEVLDNALNKVDSLRSELGAVQNRFESAIENLSTNETNLSAARSRIEDADYATEVANMTRAQILQQAGTSVLAQANQIPQNVLSLLG
ncbi:MAG: FliC/FljB family flagellin [Halomonas sp.]|jgi:flagellin|nr:FliC/FljB family flagellin [Halomonas sp.]NQY78466.1 FliC/FljB family flagellin [Halomonas sp.]